MKQSIYLILLMILYGCNTSEVVTPIEQQSQLIINWQHPSNGNSSWKANAMIYVYDKKEEYDNPLGTPIFKQSLSDKYPPNGGVITPVNSATLTNLKPIKYWVKVFNAYNHERLVEHNQDSAFTFQYPLIQNTINTVSVPTKRVYIDSYTIKKIEIYDNPSWIKSNKGETVMVNISEFFTPSYCCEEDKILHSKQITIREDFITYVPAPVTIRRFNSWWTDPDYFLTLKHTGSSLERSYEINIFQLLNANKHLKEEYVKLNSNNEIEYKIYVSWNLK